MYSTVITLLIAAFIALLFSLKKTRHKYWKKRGVPCLDRQHLIFGDYGKTILGQENCITTVENAYREFRSRGCKFGGIYCMDYPILLVYDPDMLRSVLIKDFEYFADRGIEYDAEKQPISAHMFNLDGEEWKFIRRKLTPTFTSGKLKTMFWIIEEKIDKFCDVIKKSSGENMYVFDYIERLGMDIISQTAFGLKCNALENEESPFYLATQKIFKPSFHRVIYYAFKCIFKNQANLALLLSDDPKCNDFFMQLVEDTIQYRKDKNVRVNDFLQLLMDLMEPSDGEEGLSLKKVVAQAFVFFLAAYETTARSVNMAMYELAKDLQLQQKLREEIDSMLENSNGEFNYDMVMKCELLDSIVQENFRKNPPVVYLNRVCTKDYKIPGTDVVIEKGTPILIPNYTIQMDPEYYPNPEKFDPSRFSKENQAKLKPYTLLHFGEGPRYCIGARLGLYQVKLTIIKLINAFRVTVSPKTVEPLTLSPITTNLLLQFKENIYLNFETIE